MLTPYPSDPKFFPMVRAEIGEKGDLDETFEGMETSGLQEGSSYIALKRARRFAKTLIDSDGVLDLSRLPPLIEELKQNLYPVGMEWGVEKGLFQLRALEKLLRNPELLRLLGTIDVPYREPLGEQWIRLSLEIQKNEPLKKADAMRAALSAWLTPLRQNVGSCFATAPAILIQEEHPELLLRDIKDLLETGRLKRVIRGIEHQAPLVATMGSGSLKEAVLFRPEVLARSPGLERALAAMGVIQKNHILTLLQKIIPAITPPYTSADEILEAALKQTLGITHKDVKEVQERLSPSLPSPLLRPKDGGKGQKVADYLEKLEKGRTAFILLTEHPLLKVWEYSIASFAETKGDFAQWNLYASLGFGPNESNGIGEVIHRLVQQQLDEANRKMLDIQDEYKTAYLHLNLVESRLKLATTEKELQWIRADYQSKRNEFNTLELLRDRERHKAERLAQLSNFLIDHFIDLFPKYFQEVYDPDLQEVKTGPFDDAPAGFHLLFKHGREKVSAWTPINNPEEFIESLVSFFQSAERELNEEQIGGLEREITEVITAISLHLRTKPFIESAFDRMARAHRLPPIKDPLKNLDKIEKKPWAFTSGGTMSGFISAYFSLEGSPTEKDRWVETREELLVFLIDEIKRLPQQQKNSFEAHPERSLLMHSPTHAFRLIPSLSPFKEAWNEELFTYTWVRDFLIEPQKSFYRNLFLEAPSFDRLKEEVSKILPQQLREFFKDRLRSPSPWVSITHFRELVIEVMRQDNSFISYLPLDELDALLFESLPLIPQHAFFELASDFFETLSLQFPTEIPFPLLPILTRKELRLAMGALAALQTKKNSFPIDLEQKWISFLRKREKEPPPTILFADTNWEGTYFSFQVNPGTLELDLWRVNRLGTQGAPMSSWRGWLDGSKRTTTWGIYTNPNQYLG
jgi:hypothetical protein